MDTLRSMGHDTAKLWEAIGQLVTKTLVSVQPHLEHTYYTCRQRSDDAGFGCFEARPLATPAPLRGALPHAPLLLAPPFHPSYPFSYSRPLSRHSRPWLGVTFDHHSLAPNPHTRTLASTTTLGPSPAGARLRRHV